MFLEIQKFILEGDALQIVQAFQSKDTKLTSFGSSIVDAKGLFDYAAEWKVNYVKREANMVAHHLAKGVVHCIHEIVDIDYVDPCISSIIMAGCHL